MKSNLIIISVPFARNIRYLLSSAIYHELKQKYDILIISPFISESFKGNHGGYNIKFASIPMKKMSKSIRALYTLSELLRTNGYYLRNKKRFKLYWEMSTRVKVSNDNKYVAKTFKQRIFALIGGFLGYFSLSWVLVDRTLGCFFYDKTILERYVNQYETSMIIQTANFDYQERYLSYFAKRYGIKSVFLPYTTDQYLVNGYLINKFDLICTQGPIETEFATVIHKIPHNRILELGMLWFRNLEKIDTGIQLPTKKKKQILYAGLSSTYYQKTSEFEAIDAIISYLLKNKIENIEIIYRPVATEEELKVIEERFKAYKEIVKIKLPQQSFIGMANDCTVNVSEEIKEYLSEIKMIDILVMSSSTTMMFDAMFFDKPVISCCFNSKSHVHTIDIRMAIDYDVLGIYRRGMPVAFSGVDLQNLLDKYLATPELYSEIRSEILRDWDYANTHYIQDFLARIEELAAR